MFCFWLFRSPHFKAKYLIASLLMLLHFFQMTIAFWLKVCTSQIKDLPACHQVEPGESSLGVISRDMGALCVTQPIFPSETVGLVSTLERTQIMSGWSDSQNLMKPTWSDITFLFHILRLTLMFVYNSNYISDFWSLNDDEPVSSSDKTIHSFVPFREVYGRIPLSRARPDPSDPSGPGGALTDARWGGISILLKL